MQKLHPTQLFQNTINLLADQHDEYARQAQRLSIALTTMRAGFPDMLRYRIHIRGSTGMEPIMTKDNKSLSKVRKEAIKLWQQWNNSSAEPHIEAFVVVEGLLFPLQPKDAVTITVNENPKYACKESQFAVNEELIGKIPENVLRANTTLVGWYAKEPTKPKTRKREKKK
mgnify:CR=1 FL=1